MRSVPECCIVDKDILSAVGILGINAKLREGKVIVDINRSFVCYGALAAIVAPVFGDK